MENLDDTVKSSEDAERLMGIPMLGGYPYVDSGSKATEDPPRHPCHALRRQLPLAEAARPLRTTLFSLPRVAPPRSCTSPVPALARASR